MADITGAFRLITRVTQTWRSPISVTGSFSVVETVTASWDGSAFSLIPVVPATLSLGVPVETTLTLVPS